MTDKMDGLTRRVLIAICAAVVYVMLVLSVGNSCVASRGDAPVSPDVLASLVVGNEDLPRDNVLLSLNVGPAATRIHFESLQGSSAIEEIWFGPPTGDPGCRRTADHSIYIRAALAGSPQEAAEVARAEVQSVAAIVPEVTGDKSLAPFANRAWYSHDERSGRLTFVQGNAIGDVSVFCKEGLDQQQLLVLAIRLSEKMSAAAAGTPEPPPVLPPSMEEMKLDLEGAWDAKNIGKMLGKRATNIAIQHGKGVPKAVPAAKIGGKDYLVPLSHVASILGGKPKVKIEKGQARATVLGKSVVFTSRKASVRVDGRTVKLAAAAQLKGKQAFVPLSFIKAALGKSIAWKHAGKMLLARI